ncbi:MAG TPA: hypothetical protein VD886_14760 [Herpetosiphonaceae bacterium]|nr:hypothetical protein [Herpetosiphonaceae bacterium]
MSFSYQYEAVKEAARQQEREFEHGAYQAPQEEAAERSPEQAGGWRERLVRALTPARRAKAGPECEPR